MPIVICQKDLHIGTVASLILLAELATTLM